jgi:hypothetical protein
VWSTARPDLGVLASEREMMDGGEEGLGKGRWARNDRVGNSETLWREIVNVLRTDLKKAILNLATNKGHNVLNSLSTPAWTPQVKPGCCPEFDEIFHLLARDGVEAGPKCEAGGVPLLESAQTCWPASRRNGKILLLPEKGPWLLPGDRAAQVVPSWRIHQTGKKKDLS